MALFNTLKQILTPYANKINLHTEEIEEIQGDVSDVKADLDYISDSIDISSGKSEKANIYPDLNNNIVKIFPVETPVYSAYVPCKAGYRYVVTKSANTSRFALATTEAVPAYNVPIIDGIRNDTEKTLEIVPTGNSKYLLIWFYYYPGDNTIDADTALASISIKELKCALDKIARDGVEELNDKFEDVEDVRDVTELLSDKENVFPRSSSMDVKIFPVETPVYSVYLPCVAGYDYTVKKTVASSRFAIATTQNVPVYNEPLIDIVQNNSASELSLTPTGNSHYLLIWFYYHSADSSIGADAILNGISVTQNSHGVKDAYARTEIEYLKNYIQFISVGDFNTLSVDNMNSDNMLIL